MFHSSTWATSPPVQATQAGMAYRPDIDGLRAIAVLSVVLNHLSIGLVPGGFIGVDVFFVISGYLITSIISREMAEGRFSLVRFYERRARRIFPALFAVLAATLAVGFLVMLPSDFLAAIRGTLGALLFVSNMVFWKSETGYFEETDSRTNPTLHTWSLGVEEQFYLLFPLFLLGLGALSRRRIPAVLAACTLLSFLAAAILVRSNVAAAFYLSPFRAWELLVGALLAFRAVPPLRSALLREGVVAAGVCAILLGCLLFGEETLFPGAAALLPVLGAAAVIQGGAGGTTFVGRLLSSWPMVGLGLISYSLYLWHWPVIVIAQYLNGMEPVTEYAAALLLIAVLLATASYRYIERPFRRPAPANLRGRGVRQTAVCFALLAVFCGAGLFTGGFPGRLEPRVAELDAVRLRPLPYRDCSDLDPREACRLGAKGVAPTILLWGDSHLMAVAPVIHDLLTTSGTAAVFVPVTGCAPLLSVHSRIKPSCPAHAARLQQFLESQPALRTVLLTSFWSTYFRKDGPLWMEEPAGGMLDAPASARKGLHDTMRWLLEDGRTVVLLGPVPTFEKSVPAALAMQARDGTLRLNVSSSVQHEKNAMFTDALASLPRTSKLRYVDPLALMCGSACTVQLRGSALYQDAHHLSREGAETLRQHLGSAMNLPPADKLD